MSPNRTLQPNYVNWYELWDTQVTYPDIMKYQASMSENKKCWYFRDPNLKPKFYSWYELWDTQAIYLYILKYLTWKTKILKFWHFRGAQAPKWGHQLKFFQLIWVLEYTSNIFRSFEVSNLNNKKFRNFYHF